MILNFILDIKIYNINVIKVILIQNYGGKMKKIHQYEYDIRLKEIDKLEKELAKVRKYKGTVAIYQGDNWHDNPILYQTELKEVSLMAKIRNLKLELQNLEVIVERDSEMIPLEEIMKPDLVQNIDMDETKKNRIRTIQNKIIKYPINKKMIVDSVNGACLIDVLLYRIAYLICSSDYKIDSDEILCVNPNDDYSKNLSCKLRKFITEDISQQSIIEFTSQYVNEKLSMLNEDDKYNDFKQSMIYKNMLTKFLTSYFNGEIVSEDLKIDDQVLFNKDEIRNALFSGYKAVPNYDWACMYFIKQFKDNYENIVDRLCKKYYDIYKNLSYDDPLRREQVLKSNELKKLLKDKGTKIIKDYFKRLNRKVTDIYSMFICNIENYMSKTDVELLNFKSETLKQLKKHKILPSDVPALLYIKYYLTNNKVEKKHVILNESQDYGDFLFDIFEQIFSQSGITIFGIGINSNFAIDDFENVKLNEIYMDEDKSCGNTSINSSINVKKLKK